MYKREFSSLIRLHVFFDILEKLGVKEIKVEFFNGKYIVQYR